MANLSMDSIRKHPLIEGNLRSYWYSHLKPTLARSVSFIFAIKEAGIEIECCDLPQLNTLNLGIFATLAQYEAELISKRTKDALNAKK